MLYIYIYVIYLLAANVASNSMYSVILRNIKIFHGKFRRG